MATNVSPAANGERALRKVLVALGHNDVHDLAHTIWLSSGANPACDAGASTIAANPIQVGQLGYRTDNGAPFICTVAPTAATAATFTAMKA